MRDRCTRLLGRGGLVLLVLFPLANLGNFALHAIASRALGPPSYGELNALLALLVALSVPLTAVQVVMTRAIVLHRQDGHGRGSLRRGLQQATAMAALAFVVVVVAAPLLRSYLHLGAASSVVLLGAFFVPATVGAVAKASLVAEERFATLAGIVVGGVVVRLVLGSVLLGSGGGIASALVATVLAEVATAAALLAVNRSALLPGGVEVPVPWREAGAASVAFVGFWLLTGFDVLAARHYLPFEVSGRYAAAATLARAILFLPQAVALIAFPRFSARDEADARAVLRPAAIITGALAALAALGFIVAHPIALPMLLGGDFGAPTSLVATVAAASFALAFVNLFVQYQLARGARPGRFVWTSIAGAVVLTSVWHGSAIAVAGSYLVVAASLAVFLGQATAKRSVVERRAGLRKLRGVGELDVTIVVPFYNPGVQLRSNVERLLATLSVESVRFEVIAVSDGSTDGSEATIADLAPGELRVINLPDNCGKGEALRVGLTEGRGRYLGFIDADGDLDPAQWHEFFELMRMYEADVVLGSKRHPLSEVHYPPLRHAYSWGYQHLIHLLFRLRVRDTQTGIKLIRRETLADVLPRTVERGFAFDLELFVVARRCGWRRFLEAPVRVDHHFRSTVSIRSVARMLVDTLAIAWRLHVRRAYDDPKPMPAPLPARVREAAA